MPCLVCANPNTCEAHILPRALGLDIIKCGERRTLSLAARDRIHNNIQSGIVDRSILCSACDGRLGDYDRHATEVIRLLGTESENITRNDFCVRRAEGIDHNYLALFAASVVWRAAMSNYRELADFVLDQNDVARLRAVLFDGANDVPDVAILRLVSNNRVACEAVRMAMSYPARCDEGGCRRARFSARGLLFFVKFGTTDDPFIRDNSLKTIGASRGN